MLRRAIGLLLLCFVAGCFLKPPGPAEEAGDAAREFNATSRYGELANVLGMTCDGRAQGAHDPARRVGQARARG